MTTTAGNGPFPSGTHTYNFISSPSTLVLSQNDAMAQPSLNDQLVRHGIIAVYSFPRDRSASMVRAPVGVNRNVAEDEHLTPGGHFTPRRLSGKISDGNPLEPKLQVNGFIHH